MSFCSCVVRYKAVPAYVIHKNKNAAQRASELSISFSLLLLLCLCYWCSFSVRSRLLAFHRIYIYLKNILTILFGIIFTAIADTFRLFVRFINLSYIATGNVVHLFFDAQVLFCTHNSLPTVLILV